MTLTVGLIAVINALGYLAVICAFRASFRELRSATWWFATGFMVLAGTIITRGLWWDVFMPLLRLYAPNAAAWWSEHVGRYMNIVFGMMKMSAFFCALKCREMLIPDDQRAGWSWYNAWMHPSGIRLLPWR